MIKFCSSITMNLKLSLPAEDIFERHYSICTWWNILREYVIFFKNVLNVKCNFENKIFHLLSIILQEFQNKSNRCLKHSCKTSKKVLIFVDLLILQYVFWICHSFQPFWCLKLLTKCSKRVSKFSELHRTYPSETGKNMLFISTSLEHRWKAIRWGYEDVWKVPSSLFLKISSQLKFCYPDPSSPSGDVTVFFRIETFMILLSESIRRK